MFNSFCWTNIKLGPLSSYPNVCIMMFVGNLRCNDNLKNECDKGCTLSTKHGLPHSELYQYPSHYHNNALQSRETNYNFT